MELSPLSNSILQHIYRRAQLIMRKSKVVVEPIYLDVNKPQFIQMLIQTEVDGNEYIATPIKKAIKMNYTNLYLCGYNRDGLNIKIWYFTDKPYLATQDKERIKNIIKTITVVRGLLSLGPEITDHLTLYVFPTEFCKELPANRGETIGPMHCNSGSTYLGKGVITLWREEELDKVLIHELFHHFRLDMFARDNTNRLLHLDEAYNEWLTTIVYLMIKTILKKGGFSMYKKVLQEQVNHSLKQAAKLLFHYQFQQVPELQIENSPFPQDTHVYEYYVLKAALLYHTDLVIQHLNQDNLQFKYPQMFIQVIMESLSDRFVQDINEILVKNIRFDRKLQMITGGA